MNQQIGKGSLCFSEAPFIIGTASVVGTKEGEGPLAEEFDCIGSDDKFGQDTWEAAESSLQQEALTLALGKADKKPEDMRYLFAGDLLGQLIASSFGLKTFEIPLFGLYGACSTCGEALALSSMTVAAGYADHVAAVTSSILRARKNSFVSHSNMRTSARFLQHGQLPERALLFWHLQKSKRMITQIKYLQKSPVSRPERSLTMASKIP